MNNYCHLFALLAMTSLLAVPHEVYGAPGGYGYGGYGYLGPTGGYGNNGSEAAQLTAEANRWLADAGEEGLVLVKEDTETGFDKQFGTQFRYAGDGYDLTFLMNEDIAAEDLTLEGLRTGFNGFVVNRLPLPGFQGIEGWEIRPLTPSSSFTTGVEFVSFSDGIVKLRVKTSFFAIYGIDRRVEVLEDAPTPEGAFFEVRKSFPLDLTLTASLSRFIEI